MPHKKGPQKTRDALNKALVALLAERPYDNITVQDLTVRAKISRSSFYLHFRDKDDLLISGFENIGVSSYDDLFESNDQNLSSYPDFATVLFSGSEQWKVISKALLSLNSNNAASLHMRNMLVIKTREWLKATQPELNEVDIEPTVHYLASALQGLLTWWVSNDFPFPAKTMSDHFNHLAISGLEGLLHLYPVKPSH